MTLVAILAGIGLAIGALVPRLISAIPDRAPDGPADAEAARTPYRTLAAAPRLAGYLALATALVFALLTGGLGNVIELPAFLAVGALGVALAYVDIRDHRLPDWLTYGSFAAGAILLGVAALANPAWGDYGRAWLGALAMTGGYLLLALIRPGDLGLGDVKLAASLGLLLGWLGWGNVVLGAFTAFVLGGAYSLGLVVTRRGGRKTAIPFGPFMLVGALVSVVSGEAIIDIYLGR